MGQQLAATFTALEEAGPAGELEEAFRDAESCDELRVEPDRRPSALDGGDRRSRRVRVSLADGVGVGLAVRPDRDDHERAGGHHHGARIGGA